MSLHVVMMLAGVTGSSSRVEPVSSPVVDAYVSDSGQFVVVSSTPIEFVRVTNLPGRYDYFLEYSADRRKATVEVRSDESTLEVLVETRSGSIGMARQHQFTLQNPSAR